MPSLRCAMRTSNNSGPGIGALRRGPRGTLCVQRASLISKSVIPAFIPRDDLMHQLNLWAQLSVQNDGVANFGVACKVDYFEREEVPWGFTVHMERAFGWRSKSAESRADARGMGAANCDWAQGRALGHLKWFHLACGIGTLFITSNNLALNSVKRRLQEGQVVASIKMGLDEELTSKFEFIGRKETGMPEPMGDEISILGAHFEIWKVDDNKVDETLRESIRALCKAIAQALNRYYAFGHVFSEEL